MTEITRDAEQVAKDKEAVAKMTGARDAMSAALRRIADLETVVSSVRDQAKRLEKSLNAEIYVRSFVQNDWRVVPLKDVFDTIDATIRKVL